MKKIITAVLFLAAILSAEKIRMSYSFSEPVVKSQDGYQKISIKDCINYGKEGEPSLPYYAASILLPPGQEIVRVNVLNVSYGSSLNDINVIPAGKKLPLSVMQNNSTGKAQPSAAVYASAAKFPQTETGSQSTSFLGGHAIGSFTVCPVELEPLNRKARFVKEISLEIETAPTAKAGQALKLLSGNSDLKARISKLAQNKNSAVNYNYPLSRTTEQFDILLITSNSLKSSFDNFVQYKKSVGYNMKTVTVEEIYAGFTGADNQEKIRNCIKQYYTQNGISAVILGGDADTNTPAQNIIPSRGFYANPGSDEYADNNIPSDMYYACLDGNWNTNGNDKFGEDGEEDFLAEVTIGRICVDAASEVASFTDKIIKYQKEPVVADIGKALFVGEKLWDDPQPDGTYAAPYMDELVTGASTNGYTTVGVNSMPSIQVKKLYEKDMNWQPSNVFSEFNTTGVNLLNHLGHSNTDYNMKMYSSQITTTNFQNNGVNRGYVIAYSQGCYPGAFDNRGTTSSSYSTSDCFAEKITTMTTGEVAFIANSRYGWGEQGNTNGASQYFHRQYIDAIFGENYTLIGKANQDSKEDNIAFINQDGTKKWCAYELNLFGDPTMDIWTEAPVNMSPVYPQGIQLGSSSIEISSLPANARVGISQNNVLIGRAIANSNGIATVNFFQPVSTADVLSIAAIAHNKNQFSGTIAVVTNEPYVVNTQISIGDDAGNSNGLADLSENIKLGLNLKNIGVGTADQIKAVISTLSGKVTILDNSENYGNISEGLEMIKPLAFELQISDSLADQQSIPLKLEIFSNNSLKWTSNLSFNVNAPNPLINNCVVNDLTANNNGMLDPNETAKLKFDILNNGHFALPAGTLSLSCNNTNMAITANSLPTTVLSANASQFAEFEVKANSITTGTEVVFTLNWQAGSYILSKTFSQTVGVTENFENSFTVNPWELSGNANWTIDNSIYFNGTKSAKSGDISAGQSSVLKLQYNVLSNGKISYYKKVSSEVDYDYLTFYIDGVKKEESAGELPWSKSEFSIANGLHTLTWEYKKDNYLDAGSDCAWLDFIILQGGSTSSIGDLDNLPLVNELSMNYPNPFNPSTAIKFALAGAMNISLKVYDAAGREIATVAKGNFTAGRHSVEFDGSRFASGIYFYQLQADGKLIGRNKMMLLK